MTDTPDLPIEDDELPADEAAEAQAAALGDGNLPPPPSLLDLAGADSVPLGRYAERAYLEYAVSVVKGRALPEVADGQKPVQRRILYAMHEMGLGSVAKPVKSARVVGEVLGKFHPHGDSSAYEAMVRMAQDFSLRYPLVDGQGNFGSRDGDGAAAMRYTEARLTKIAELLLSEINMGTADFIPNYDGAFEEPKLLPARLPMLLLNGASGIAVGMATEIPPHNLTEVAEAAVALIKNPRLEVADLLDIVQGPDFPGGGQIISSREQILAAYEGGRGSLAVRARWKVEELARGQWQLVITELPPNSSSQKVLEEIEDLTNPKIKKGKKALTQEQVQLKQLLLSQLDTVRDESGKDVAIRLVFEPKSRTQNPEEFANMLLTHTSLEGNASINLVAIGIDGRPQQKSLKQLLAEWIQYRFATVRRRTAHRLGQVDDRIHILEGRLLVYLNIDEVIRIIRQADDPKADLIAAFSLSERQADDILEIRLRQLARLEGIKIEQELAKLRDEKAELEHLLADEGAMQKLIVKEIRDDAKTFGDARRTLIEAKERATVVATVVDEPLTVILSDKGWIRARNGHGIDTQNLSFKEGDSLLAALECRSVDTVALFGSDGRVYNLLAGNLPGGRGDGVPVASLIDLAAKTRIVQLLAAKPEQALLIAGANGYAFHCEFKDLLTRQKAGKAFLSLDDGEALLKIAPFVARDSNLVCCLSTSGRLHAFPLAELKALSGGGRGMIAMALDDGDTLAAITVSDGETLTLNGIGRGGKAMALTFDANDLAPYVGKRAKKGKPLVGGLKLAGF
ncbi:DNA topoisomerase IV subunit A [Chitinimonas taiwanensis]|jgi:topoisomerase-4 subunit A|uniref:DNA topoisomerase 4 subunit A n=1 Tax=Chitinimonas taiwanensis DSM 18899 TaxID=1121279 RepID=A0A1K2H4Q0_9NEIS|nr:DNA topoisomerase IV subunit A [Chitinimonas taiwanensis]SFZ70898.1 topoisomerase-4 subunit A [Chitinimonas taiwanensis DSM 18899]